MRGRIALLASLLLGVGACAPQTTKCAAGTIFVRVTLEGGAAQADQLLVDIRVGSGAAMSTPLTHEPGETTGGIRVEFPKGYPTGETVTVTISARLAGVELDDASESVLLTGGCASIDILLAAANNDLRRGEDGGQDLTMPPSGDLASADLAISDDQGSNDDLESVADLTTAPLDFTGVTLDLSPAADLTPTCVPSTEDCFNDVDDDCDLLVDCGDPDCTGGATPPAICVPGPGLALPGMTTMGSCPTTFPTTTVIHTGLSSSCSSSSCTGCGGGTTTCGVQLHDDANNSSCGSGPAYTIPMGICSLAPIPNGDYHHVGAPAVTGVMCNGPSGSSTKLGPTWATTEKFCSGGPVGSGCTGGKLCVPAAPNHCVLIDGSFVGACPSGYSGRGFSYYTGYDDSSWTCSCVCQTQSLGSCTGTPSVTRNVTSACADGVTFANGCSNDAYGATQYVFASGITPATNGSCVPTSNSTNSPTATGPKTICCLP